MPIERILLFGALALFAIWVQVSDGKWAKRTIALLSFALAGLFFYTSLDPRMGLPSYNQLAFTSGNFVSGEKDKYGFDIKLDSSDITFRYPSKADDHAQIWAALHKGIQIDLGHEPPSDGRVTIFEISANGQMLKSYAEIEAAWISGNKLGRWLFGGFIMVGSYLWWASGRRDEEVSTQDNTA